MNNHAFFTTSAACDGHEESDTLKEKKRGAQQLGLGLELTQKGSDIDLFEAAGADYILQLQEFLKNNISNSEIECLISKEIALGDMHTLRIITYSAYFVFDSVLIIARHVDQESHRVNFEGDWEASAYSEVNITKAILNPSLKLIAHEVGEITKRVTSHVIQEEIGKQKQQYMQQSKREIDILQRELEAIQQELIHKSSTVEKMAAQMETMKIKSEHDAFELSYLEEKSKRQIDILLTEIIKPNSLFRNLYYKLLELIHSRETIAEDRRMIEESKKAKLRLKLFYHG